MPITSVYDIGTVTLSQGSRTVTGQGTQWLGAAIREGDMFWAQGLSVRVLELVDDVTLRLAHNWMGTSITENSYELMYTPDFTRTLSKSVELLSSLDLSALNPLKGITPSNNDLVYYTGAATANTTKLTGKGRELLEQTEYSDMVTLLGLLFNSSRYSTTAGNITRNGDHGLGALVGENRSNIDSGSISTCFFTVDPLSVLGDLPPDVGAKDGVLNFRASAAVAFQLYFSSHARSPIYYRRSTAATTWQSWKEIT